MVCYTYTDSNDSDDDGELEAGIVVGIKASTCNIKLMRIIAIS